MCKVRQRCSNTGRQVAMATNFFFQSCARYLWMLSMDLASCHLSDTYDFEVASKFLDNLCTPELKSKAKLSRYRPEQAHGDSVG